jgi:hypothetical protein
MTTTATEYSTMIAVFSNRDQADQAIDNLRQAGYSYDQIRLVQRANSFMDNLKSLFTGQGAATTNSADDWMRIGVPEQDAHRFQDELGAGRSIVLIKAVDNPEQALSIMRQSGAYDITSRLRTMPSTTAPGMQNPNAAPGTYNPNAQPGAYNPNAAPETPIAQPRTNNPNATPETPIAQPRPSDVTQP